MNKSFKYIKNSNPYLFLPLIALLIFITPCSGWAQDFVQDEPQQPDNPAMDQRALGVLKRMSDTISGAKTVSFQARSMVPLKTQSGMWINLYSDARVITKAPDKIFVETKGDFTPYNFYYNGKTITRYDPENNFYAEKPAPATLDAVIEGAYDEEGSSFPYADILVSDPYEALTQDMAGAFYVGETTVDGARTEHIAFANEHVEWQMWVGVDDNLPRLVSAEYLDEINEPSYTVEFSQWKLNDEIQPSVFTFENKYNALKIEFGRPGKPR